MSSKSSTVETGPRRALVAGATGLVGGELLQLLLASAEYQRVHLVQRRPLGVDDPKASDHVVSFDELATLDLGDRITDAFCALGTTIAKAGSVEQLQKVDRDYVRDFGELAARTGVERFAVVSALGADPKSINYYNRTKGEMETLLAELDLASLRIFRPSLLLGPREERRPKEILGAVVLGGLSPLLMGPLRRYRGIEAARVARAMYATSLEDFPGVRVFESEEIQGY